jgi:hypothetical protein
LAVAVVAQVRLVGLHLGLLLVLVALALILGRRGRRRLGPE